jgi:dUTP pyrophosphatase
MVTLKVFGSTIKKAHPCDAGFDLFSFEETELKPGEMKMVSCNVKFIIPEGYYIQYQSRSSMLFKRRLSCLPGVIDSGYTGDASITLYNFGVEIQKIEIGDKIGQGILLAIPDLVIRNIDEEEFNGLAKHKARGNNGFGSTGK